MPGSTGQIARAVQGAQVQAVGGEPGQRAAGEEARDLLGRHRLAHVERQRGGGGVAAAEAGGDHAGEGRGVAQVEAEVYLQDAEAVAIVPHCDRQWSPAGGEGGEIQRGGVRLERLPAQAGRGIAERGEEEGGLPIAGEGIILALDEVAQEILGVGRLPEQLPGAGGRS